MKTIIYHPAQAISLSMAITECFVAGKFNTRLLCGGFIEMKDSFNASDTMRGVGHN
jgi:hypothetical protein